MGKSVSLIRYTEKTQQGVIQNLDVSTYREFRAEDHAWVIGLNYEKIVFSTLIKKRSRRMRLGQY